MFPVAPYVSMETLQWLYESNIIDWEHFSRHAQQMHNFPVRKRPAPDGELPQMKKNKKEDA